jgi:hypothetical protein
MMSKNKLHKQEILVHTYIQTVTAKISSLISQLFANKFL